MPQLISTVSLNGSRAIYLPLSGLLRSTGSIHMSGRAY